MVTTMDEQNEIEAIRAQVKERVDQEAKDLEQPDAKDKELTPTFIRQCLEANELGDGMLYATINRPRLRYCITFDSWFIWGGHYWKPDLTRTAEHLIEGVVAAYHSITPSGDENPALEKMINRRVERLRSVSGVKKTLLMSIPIRNPDGSSLITITSDALDRRARLLVCDNGVIDLETGELHDGRREHHITVACPLEWAGIDTPAPRWERFLLEVLSDPEVCHYLCKALGYALLGECTQHVMHVAIGGGRNGKSTLFEEILRILGTSICRAIKPELLLAQQFSNASGPSPEIMSLRGRKIVFTSEVDRHQKFSLAAVKRLTGGDTLVGRPPHGVDEVSFRPTHSLFLLCNDIPHSHGDDAAFMARIRVIKFPNKVVMFKEPDPDAGEIANDPNLKKDLEAESQGILAWLVRGCLLYQIEGLEPPEVIIRHTKEYQEDEDVIGAWLAERQDTTLSGRTAASVLYEDFSNWLSKTNTGKPWGSRTFYSAVKVKAKWTRDSGGRYYDIILLP